MSIPVIFSPAKNQNVLIIYHNPTGAATFDPSITTSISTTVYWKTENGVTVTTGTMHNLSYTPTAGPKKCEITVVGGIRLIATITCDADLVAYIKNLTKCSGCTSINVDNNPLSMHFGEFPPNLQIFSALTNYSLYGNFSQLPRSLSTFKFIGSSGALLPLSGLAGCTIIDLRLPSASCSGPMSDVPATCQIVYLYSGSFVTAGPIAHLTAIRDLRIYSMGWNRAGVDTVISSMWVARANYTYAVPMLQIGGTNADPSGTYAAPSEGADWHEDSPGHWVPLTGLAMAYDLCNDVNGEGFNVWSITY